MMAVPGAPGHKFNVALEDVRASQMTSDITLMLQDAIDQLDDGVAEMFESSQQSSSSTSNEDSTCPNHGNPESCEYRDQHPERSFVGINDGISDAPADAIDKPPASTTPPEPAVSERIQVYQPLNNAYYPRVVTETTSYGQRIAV